MTDQLIQAVSPSLASRIQIRLIQISPVFTGAPAQRLPNPACAGPSHSKSDADLLRRRGHTGRPPETEKPKPQMHPFRVGLWVYNLLTSQVAVIEQRVPPRNGPNGPEEIFLMEAEAASHLGWSQFDIRLATQEEIAAEQGRRTAKKEQAERERAERTAKWAARREEKERIRGTCILIPLSLKSGGASPRH